MLINLDVSHFNISHININANESKHIYLSKFININMNMENARMTYIVTYRQIFFKKIIDVNIVQYYNHSVIIL